MGVTADKCGPDVIPANAEHGKGIRGKTVSGFNYTAAFVMVASGTATISEISKSWGIPVHRLTNKSQQENWSGLIRRYGHVFAPKIEVPKADMRQLEEKAKKVQENRDRTLKSAHGLLERVQFTIDSHPKDQPMDPEIIANLARAVKMLGEISMVASGDEYAVRGVNGGGTKGGSGSQRPHGPLISITFPSMLGGPRKIRQVQQAIEAAERGLAEDSGEDEIPDNPGAVLVEAQVEESSNDR